MKEGSEVKAQPGIRTTLFRRDPEKRIQKWIYMFTCEGSRELKEADLNYRARGNMHCTGIKSQPLSTLLRLTTFGSEIGWKSTFGVTDKNVTPMSPAHVSLSSRQRERVVAAAALTLTPTHHRYRRRGSERCSALSARKKR